MDTEKAGNKLAVIALTAGGANLGKRISEKTGASLYLPVRLKTGSALEKNICYFDNFKKIIKYLFSSYQALIFIMATGIVVRTIAPLLQSKYTDPAVVVMDEAGEFAISLVSGHVGGANRLARRLASLVGGNPVITTATDVNDRPAVDVLANQLECVPSPLFMVKMINRALAEGEPVSLRSRWPLPEELIRGFQNEFPLSEGVWKVIVARSFEERGENTLCLFPRNLVVGLGCRRGVAGEMIIEVVKRVLAEFPAGKERLKSLATVDIKKDEAGIFHAARYFGVPVKIISRTDILNLPEAYQESEFVKKTLGVGGVCEPAAIIASNRGRVVVPKRKMSPVTVAVAEEKLWWWD